VSSIVFVVPGSLGARSGGYEYDRRMVAGLRAIGWTVAVLEIHSTFPNPSAAERREAATALASIPDGTVVVADGLAFGAIPAEVERDAGRLRFVPIVHMPLAHDSSLDPAAARDIEARERRALSAATIVVTTGSSSARVMLEYGVAGNRVVLVEPGTGRALLAAGSWDPSVVHMVCVAAVTPGKGHDVLLRALATLPHRGWRLSCVGSLDRAPAFVNELRAMLKANKLEDLVTLAGEGDELAVSAAYDAADLFVLATRHETFGMAVAEALARGLPIVATATGAIPDLVGSDAGIIVPPGDESALAGALASAMDPRTREELAQGARRARERLVPWDATVARMAAVLSKAGA
jgi:glycosyltransferase involved in cell wall biosynthesis